MQWDSSVEGVGISAGIDERIVSKFQPSSTSLTPASRTITYKKSRKRSKHRTVTVLKVNATCNYFVNDKETYMYPYFSFIYKPYSR